MSPFHVGSRAKERYLALTYVTSGKLRALFASAPCYNTIICNEFVSSTKVIMDRRDKKKVITSTIVYT